jgi:hypothetical protein
MFVALFPVHVGANGAAAHACAYASASVDDTVHVADASVVDVAV